MNHDIFTISTFNFVTKFDYLLYHNNQTLNNSENSLTSPQATIRVEESPKELKVTREIGISVTLKMVSTEVPFAKVSEEILAKLCICIDTGMIRVSVIAMASRRHASELFLLQTSEPRPARSNVPSAPLAFLLPGFCLSCPLGSSDNFQPLVPGDRAVGTRCSTFLDERHYRGVRLRERWIGECKVRFGSLAR